MFKMDAILFIMRVAPSWDAKTLQTVTPLHKEKSSFKSCKIKLNQDFNYTFPIDLAQYRNSFDTKSIVLISSPALTFSAIWLISPLLIIINVAKQYLLRISKNLPNLQKLTLYLRVKKTSAIYKSKENLRYV